MLFELIIFAVVFVILQALVGLITMKVIMSKNDV